MPFNLLLNAFNEFMVHVLRTDYRRIAAGVDSFFKYSYKSAKGRHKACQREFIPTRTSLIAIHLLCR